MTMTGITAIIIIALLTLLYSTGITGSQNVITGITGIIPLPWVSLVVVPQVSLEHIMH